MAAKIRYTATGPDGEAVSVNSTRQNIQFATFCKFDDPDPRAVHGWIHLGWSSAATLDKAVKSAKSTQPYAQHFAARPVD